MSSTAHTTEYKKQRPPRFVNQASSINVNEFTKSGNDADTTYIVQGDAEKAVHYHQFPQVSQTALSIMGSLVQDIQLVSGVDGRYTGRDTGSVLTTGGVNSMLDQVTMIDAYKIENYERYCKQLTKLILKNYLGFTQLSRKYLVTKDDLTWDTVDVVCHTSSADHSVHY